MNKAKDLTKEPPRSPRIRVRDYAILGRTIDKCRALLWSNVGEYHYDCPLDNYLFSFKGIHGDDFKRQVESGASDEQLGIWVDQSGVARTPEEIKLWSDSVEAARPYDDPEKRDWFAEACKPLGLDPQKATLFDMLEADDKASFSK